MEGCPQELEHLLFLLKEERNSVGHKNERVINLSDAELEKLFNETKQQINEIIEQTGVRANVDRKEIKRVKKKLQDSIEQYRSIMLFTSFDKYRILDFLKKDDIEANYLADLENYFTGELKGFTAPNFLHKSENFVSNLKHLLRIIENSQIAIIYGEAGRGKTSLSK